MNIIYIGYSISNGLYLCPHEVGTSDGRSILLGTAANSRLRLQLSIICYRLTGYRSGKFVAQGTKGKVQNKQKYMNRIMCLAELSLR